MAYRSQEWKPAIYCGQKLTGIKEHREDNTKFLFDVSLLGIRRKKFITIEGGYSQRYQKALGEYAQFRKDTRDYYCIDAETFGELFTRWLHLKKSSRWTRQIAGTYNNHISQFIGDTNLREVSAQDIDALMIEVKDKADRTRAGIIAIIKSVFDYAVDIKMIHRTPIEKRHGVTVNRLEQKTLILDAVNQYKTVYSSIMKVFANDPQWRAIFLLGLNGRRKSEVLSLPWRDISMESKSYIIRGTNSKVKQDLIFVLPGDVLAALQEISVQHNTLTGLIFPNPRTGGVYTDIRKQVQMIRDYSGYSQFGFHRMRNLVSSAFFSRGVNASHLSSLLGHTDPRTLKQYLSMERIKSGEIIEEAAQKLLEM